MPVGKGPLQYHCPAFARCGPKIPSFRRAVVTGGVSFRCWAAANGSFQMTIRASAGSALLFAAGLLMSLAGPAPAIAAGEDGAAVSKSEGATSGKSVKQGSRHLKKHYTHRKHTGTASKSAEGRQVEEKQVADASGATPPAVPGWLANANAQMTAADVSPDSAGGMSAAMSEKANTMPQAADKPAEAETSADAASDQLSDADRALQEAPSAQTPVTQGVVMASTSRPTSESASSDSSTLDKTSLIGKFFIAVGALLTVASAARMFMA